MGAFRQRSFGDLSIAGARDRFEHMVELEQHLSVGEAHDADAALFKPSGSTSIVIVLSGPVVVIAIDLDHQALLHAVEIHHVAVERVLATKLVTLESPVT